MVKLAHCIVHRKHIPVVIKYAIVDLLIELSQLGLIIFMKASEAVNCHLLPEDHYYLQKMHTKRFVV